MFDGETVGEQGHILTISMRIPGIGGALSTRGGVVFAGYRDFSRVLDAETGNELWKVNLGARVRGSPICFSLGGRQYIRALPETTYALGVTGEYG